MSRFLLGPKAKVYDAEILGLYEGLEAALTSSMEPDGWTNLWDSYLQRYLNVAQKAGLY